MIIIVSHNVISIKKSFWQSNHRKWHGWFQSGFPTFYHAVGCSSLSVTALVLQRRLLQVLASLLPGKSESADTCTFGYWNTIWDGFNNSALDCGNSSALVMHSQQPCAVIDFNVDMYHQVSNASFTPNSFAVRPYTFQHKLQNGLKRAVLIKCFV